MHNHSSDNFLEKQGSPSAWVRNPSHHVQLTVCLTDVEVSDLFFIFFFFHLLCYCALVSFFLFHPYISMVTFLVAFLVLCFEDSNIITITSIGSLGGVITVLVVWCIWTSWEKHPPSDAQPCEKLLSFEEDDDTEERSKKFTFVVVPDPPEEHQHSTVGFTFPLTFDWPSFINRRRQSYDSNGTVVEEP